LQSTLAFLWAISSVLDKHYVTNRRINRLMYELELLIIAILINKTVSHCTYEDISYLHSSFV